ncbi:E3 ubiquitin-protein ligase TRIM35-like [Thunnus thynnus]|uniref:E3 ubiquitin-protein ligase TRIM35-like n=1 Tax=Thunnus thynnus TaxID=8237 RepID=UPI003528F60E
MAFQSEMNLSCPVCCEIFQDPVLLSCGHSFCKACLQRWWTEKPSHKCPVCRRRFLHRNLPRNLALKNLCEAFLEDRAQTASAGAKPRCRLHNERLRLFCLNHQQPVCVICLHSATHTNHSIRPINEAARDNKNLLQELLKPFREKLELFNDIKQNFDQTTKDIELQYKDTERQIKDVFSMLQQFLQKEEKVRITALRKEEKQKSQMLKRKIEALDKEIAALSGTIGATEEAMRAEDLRFLQNYKTAAERVQQPLPDVPEPIPGALLDMDKHLNNLPSVVLDKMKEMVTTSEVLQPKTSTDPLWYRPRDPEVSNLCNIIRAASRTRLSLAFPPSNETSGLNLRGYESHFSPLTAPSTRRISQSSTNINNLYRT